MESMSVLVGNTRLLLDKQLVPSLVTDNLWTVTFDADGKLLKRYEHEDNDDTRNACGSLTNNLTNVQTWSCPMTQLPNVQSYVTHHHPVLQAKKLRRSCMFHLVEFRTLRRMKVL